MKKKYLTIIFGIFILFSCTNPKEVLVKDKDSRKYVNEIKSGLDSKTAIKFEENYKQVLMWGELGEKGRAAIAKNYGERYEFLTLGYLLNYTLTDFRP